jgi:hypothetical protein
MKFNYYLFLTASFMAANAASVHAQQLTVDLGTAANYVILASAVAAPITTTPGTSITGDLGVSPAALSTISGFDQSLHSSGQYATSSLVTGKIFAADMGGQTAADLTVAVGHMQAAYTDAAGRSDPDHLNLGSGSLNSTTQVLTPGLYNWNSNVTITDSVTIDGGGDSSAVWIFQIENRLTLASSAQIILSGNANPSNIFWQTAEGATIGTNAHFIGTILTMTDVAMQTDASMVGRFLAQTAVTLDSNDLTVVPEPATYAALFGLGALVLVAIRRRAKKAA